ncbi:efflux RND transporter periplasmic adaptor subunit, partial [Rhizobium ruizarguesonis]
AKATVDKDKAMIVRDTATLSEAETALTRAQDLFDQKAGNQQALDQAVAARDTAAATVEADKESLASDQIILEHTDI